MRTSVGQALAFARRAVAGACLMALFPFSCQQSQQTASVPPTPPPEPPTPVLTLAQQGDQLFEIGDYASARAAYDSYLRDSPSGDAADQALFRLALIYALPGEASADSQSATRYLTELVARFPSSPLRPQAELILRLQGQIHSLRAEIAQTQIQVDVLASQISELKQDRVAEMELLRSGLRDREERVRQLSEELDKLKAIDMQRRSAPLR